MKTYKTFLPVFPGFYNTIFEADESIEIDNINDLRAEKNKVPIDYDDCKFNYEEYQKNICEASCNIIEEKLKEFLNDEIVITLEKIVSPRYYNYSNDSINIEIEIDLKNLVKILLANYEEFYSYIKNKYTSCPGFISHYSNDADDWIIDLNDKNSNKEHLIGSCLDFICEINDYTDFNLYEDCTYKDCLYIYAENFEELTK